MSWDHHRVVAALDTDAERKTWLRRAAKEGWSAARLLKEIRKDKEWEEIDIEEIDRVKMHSDKAEIEEAPSMPGG